MEIREVKNLIQLSKFSPNSKQSLINTLFNLGTNTLLGLGKEVSRGDSKLIESFLVHIWTKYSLFFELVTKQDFNKAYSLFFEAFDYYSQILDEEQRRLFLYFVLDVRSLVSMGKFKVNIDDYKKIISFEIEHFDFLNQEEIIFLISHHVLDLIEAFKLTQAIEAMVIDNLWGDDDKFFDSCLYELKMNKSLLGLKVKKSVKEWIELFTGYTNLSLADRGTVHITEFIVKNNFVRQLDAKEKDILLEILKLFLWLLNPSFSYETVLEYKRNKEFIANQKFVQLAKQDNLKFKNKPLLEIFSVEDVNNSNLNVTTENSVNIDAKLKALRSRVSNQKIKS